jgi:hypothetical protein
MAVIYFATGPFLACLQLGHLCQLPKPSVVSWLKVAKALPLVIVSILLRLLTLQSKATTEKGQPLPSSESSAKQFTTTLLTVMIITLVLAGLAQVVQHFTAKDFPPTESVDDVNKKSDNIGDDDRQKGIVGPLVNVLNKDLLLFVHPMAFFTGLFEAFMTRYFLMVSSCYKNGYKINVFL